jgi:hypothetical protein
MWQLSLTVYHGMSSPRRARAKPTGGCGAAGRHRTMGGGVLPRARGRRAKVWVSPLGTGGETVSRGEIAPVDVGEERKQALTRPAGPAISAASRLLHGVGELWYNWCEPAAGGLHYQIYHPLLLRSAPKCLDSATMPGGTVHG